MRRTINKLIKTARPIKSAHGRTQPLDHELQQLFIEVVADLLNVEKQLGKALPKMARAAQSTELAEAFLYHLDQTEVQVDRLEQVFLLLDREVKNQNLQNHQRVAEYGANAEEE